MLMALLSGSYPKIAESASTAKLVSNTWSFSFFLVGIWSRGVRIQIVSIQYGVPLKKIPYHNEAIDSQQHLLHASRAPRDILRFDGPDNDEHYRK